MSRSRGFVYYDLWITVALVALAVLVIVPAVYGGIRKARLRRAGVELLQRIAAAEADSHDRTHAWLDALPFALPAGTKLLVLRGDSSGWSAAVVADSSRRTQVSCGAFQGPASLAPAAATTTPGRIACW